MGRDHRLMKTMIERLTWLKDLRNKSWEQMSTDAGLDPKHLAGYSKRVAEKPSANLTAEVLDKIARSEGCNAEWLRTGQGEPGLAVIVPKHQTDPFPSRAAIVAMARAKGVDRGAVEALASEQRSDGRDPGELYWRGRLLDRIGVAGTERTVMTSGDAAWVAQVVAAIQAAIMRRG